MTSPPAGPDGRRAIAVDLVARDLSIRYPRRPVAAVEGITFDVPAGSCLLVAGPSGSGKSTLARAIAGLIPASVPARIEGRLSVGDQAVGGPASADLVARTGVVFQDPASQLVMERVEDDVAFGLEGRGWSREAMRARVPRALAAAGLAGFERRRTAHLSGGEQQRLALSGALAPEPALLVLDEPTANLDPGASAALAADLAALRDRRDTTIVLVEHRADLAWALADLVLVLDAAGRQVAFGEPGAVLAGHRTTLREAGIWLPGEEIPAPSGGTFRRNAALADAPLLVIDRAVMAWGKGGRPVVDGVSLALRPGERVAVVGPNGSGKSTLARLAVGLLRPDGGTVRLAGHDPAILGAAALARLAGYVTQDPERSFLAPTVASEILLGLRPDEAAGAATIAEALRLPLGAFGDRNPFTLSGGEQRRLSVAAQLVRRPRLLVLDEPTFGQDRRGYDGLVAILRERVAAGTAVLSVTHDERFAREMADRRVVISGGHAAEPDR